MYNMAGKDFSFLFCSFLYNFIPYCVIYYLFSRKLKNQYRIESPHDVTVSAEKKKFEKKKGCYSHHPNVPNVAQQRYGSLPSFFGAVTGF